MLTLFACDIDRNLRCYFNFKTALLFRNTDSWKLAATCLYAQLLHFDWTLSDFTGYIYRIYSYIIHHYIHMFVGQYLAFDDSPNVHYHGGPAFSAFCMTACMAALPRDSGGWSWTHFGRCHHHGPAFSAISWGLPKDRMIQSQYDQPINSARSQRRRFAKSKPRCLPLAWGLLLPATSWAAKWLQVSDSIHSAQIWVLCFPLEKTMLTICKSWDFHHPKSGKPFVGRASTSSSQKKRIPSITWGWPALKIKPDEKRLQSE